LNELEFDKITSLIDGQDTIGSERLAVELISTDKRAPSQGAKLAAYM
jgi:hypothetical protein